jgi:phage anti-repressor protein
MNKKETELVISYQRTFPELLQDENGFCIDGEILCNQLGIKDDFNNWLLRETKGKEGKLIKYKCIENTDFISDWENPNAKFSKEDIQNMSPQQRSANKIKNKIKLTLECAKKIAMRQNNDKGDLVCDYFKLMEKTLRNYESWSITRESESKEYLIMVDELKKWCERNNYDIDEKIFKSFRIRESNMLNMNLTGKIAGEIKTHIGYKDNITRNHLDEKRNSAILNLQQLNTNLLIANMDFETRSNLIKTVCETKYSDLYLK